MDNIIKELVKLCPSTNKDVRLLSNGLEKISITDLYNKILKTRLSNKDALYFLNIMNRFPRQIEIDALINFKCYSNDKYISQFLVSYFNLAIKYLYAYADENLQESSLSQRNKIDIFLKFIYIFEQDLSRDINLYNTFKVFLREGFLDAFSVNKFYRKFVFLKEFLVDFADKLDDRLIEIGFDCEDYKELIYQIKPTNYILKWNSNLNFVELFYCFDLNIYKDNMTDKHPIIDLLGEMTYDLTRYSTEEEIKNGQFMFDTDELEKATKYIEHKIAEKYKFNQIVDKLNDENRLEEVDMRYIYLCKRVSLKSLGEVLCKEKNLHLLHKWCNIFDFNDYNLLESLRLFLNSFQLSGESQVIDRIINAFSRRFCECQNITEDKDISDIFKVSYSFVFLNTMIYKTTTDKKMTFTDYCIKTDSKYFTEEQMRMFYDSIIKNEIEFPMHWRDSYEKYKISKQIETETFEYDINKVFAAYKYLFLTNIEKYTNTDIKTHYKTCMLFEVPDIFLECLRTSENVQNILEGFLLLIKNRKLAQKDIDLFIQNLVKIEKPKTQSMFKMFGNTRKLGVLTQYQNIYNKLVSIKFKNTDIFEHNIKELNQVNDEFIKEFTNTLILNNIDLLSDFTMLDKETKYSYIISKPDKFNSLDLDEKIEVLERVFTGDSDDFILFYNLLKELIRKPVRNKKLFDIYILAVNRLQQEDLIEIDPFKDCVEIKENQDGTVIFIEKFPHELKNTSNFLKWIGLCKKSVFNVSWLKANFSKNTCPLKNDQIMNFYSITYLLSKMATLSESKIQTYEYYYLDALSESLGIYIELILFLVNHNFYINELNAPINIKDITKMFVSKLKNVKLCCDQEDCLFNVDKMYEISKQLYNYGVINKNALDKIGRRRMQGSLELSSDKTSEAFPL